MNKQFFMISLGLVNFISCFFLVLTTIMGGMVVIKKHPVHAVLCLIATFCCGSGLLLINNAEFLAFMVLTVYVGAVMVLFLFVVIMIDIDSIQYSKNNWYENTLILGTSVVLFAFLFSSMNSEILAKKEKIISATNLSIVSDSIDSNKNQAKELGKILYNQENALIIVSASLILFVGIIGAIILTLREKTGLKKQNLFTQLTRSSEDTLEIKTVTSGAGVNDE